MTQASYSPLMLIAVDGLIQNQGLAVNAQFVSAVSSYRNINAINLYKTILSNAIASGLANNVVLSMQTLASTVLPAVTDAITPAYISAFGSPSADDSTGLSGQVLQQANLVMGNGDLGKFVQIYNSAQAYIFQNNGIIDSLTSSNLLDSTFTTMSGLTTSNISDVNRNLSVLSQDLRNLGQAWNLENLDFLGYPWALVSQMNQQAGMLPEFISRLTDNGVTTEQLTQLVTNGQAASLETNSKIYKTMQTVTGALLEQVKFLLGVTTTGLGSMADLLNPARALPNSYQQLTLRTSANSSSPPFGTTLTDIYLSSNTVNSNLLSQFSTDDSYQDLAKVVPPDIALANRAISRSLLQVKNIFVTDLPDFSTAVTKLEGNQDLPLIEALELPIPLAIENRLKSMFATGTGFGGSITLFDMIGVATGKPYTEIYQQLITGVTELESTGALLTLTKNFSQALAYSNDTASDGPVDPTNGVYTVMQYTLAGAYDEVIVNPDPEEPDVIIIVIPSPLPGAGIYATSSDAFETGLIPAAESSISDIATSNPASTASLNSATTDIVTALINEKQNFALTNIDVNELEANDRSSIMGFASNLHEIGSDFSNSGSAVYVDAVADRTNLSGQAVVAAMREGRNIQSLNDVGIQLDTQI